MNKKGIDVTGVTLGLILGVILLVVLLFIFKQPASQAGTFFSSETLKTRDLKCKFDMERAQKQGIGPHDTDLDGRPDSCDICVNHPNDRDDDLDGMPTICDKDDTDRTIVACAGTLSKDDRCLI